MRFTLLGITNTEKLIFNQFYYQFCYPPQYIYKCIVRAVRGYLHSPDCPRSSRRQLSWQFAYRNDNVRSVCCPVGMAYAISVIQRIKSCCNEQSTTCGHRRGVELWLEVFSAGGGSLWVLVWKQKPFWVIFFSYLVYDFHLYSKTANLRQLWQFLVPSGWGHALFSIT